MTKSSNQKISNLVSIGIDIGKNKQTTQRDLVRYSPSSGRRIGVVGTPAYYPYVWTSCLSQERICRFSEVASMYPA